MKKVLKKTGYTLIALLVLFFLLMIPDTEDTVAKVPENKTPFAWNKDEQWLELEALFRQAKQTDSTKLNEVIVGYKKAADKFADYLTQKNINANDSALIKMEDNFFKLASLVAIKQKELPWLLTYYNNVRNTIKRQSQQWDMENVADRNMVYRLLYGMRAATEEVLLQSDSLHFSPALYVKNEKSVTPAAYIFGIEVHSGDLLVSRGGAEVSALISRGNNYPGNFSHIALVYVDEKSREPFLIEAHIEKGVALASVAQYEQDKKLRFMVMRPRADLPVMLADSMLPQKAAFLMYQTVKQRHIPYDFKMNFRDSGAMFCSEVASFAYLKKGIEVWKYPSNISSQGVVNWLRGFGVEYFVTQMPSDLEYDPQLSVVAEWRDPETLYKDHLDNAVMDALLEKANEGQQIGYNTWKLPAARLLKGYCMILNLFGKTGLIPEGMSATRALKNQTFVALHEKVKNKTSLLADEFKIKQGYQAPYWQLVKFAEDAANESE